MAQNCVKVYVAEIKGTWTKEILEAYAVKGASTT